MCNDFACGTGLAFISAHLEDLSAIEKLNCTSCFFQSALLILVVLHCNCFDVKDPQIVQVIK